MFALGALSIHWPSRWSCQAFMAASVSIPSGGT